MATLSLSPYTGWLIALAAAVVGLLAWMRGGPAEKGGALMVAVAWAVILGFETVSVHGFVTHASLPVWLVSVPILLTDFLLSCGLLVLALRYANLWVGVAMLAQSAQLALQAYYLAESGGHGLTYAIGSNVSSGVLLAAMLAGTISSWRKRTVVQTAARRTLP